MDRICMNIRRLVRYGLRTGLLPKEETVYATNLIMDVLGLTEMDDTLPMPKVRPLPEDELADILAEMRAYAAANGLADDDGNDALDLHALLEDNGYAARYPFLLDLPSKLAVSTGGWEIYCIVPADEDVSITVNEFGWPSWDAEGPVAGEVLWESGSGTPLCIAANVSDIMPDTQITVTAADGTAIIYQPFLSLRDGSLAVPEDGTVYDFTVYPEGFVRETTA